MSRRDEAIKELFDQYQAAIVSACDPEGGWVDPALACLERGQDAVVITAWNPGFERPSQQVNRERNEELKSTLLASGHQVWPADGSDPDGSMSEEGFLVWGMDVEHARLIGRAFGQFAIYAYDREGVRLVVAC
jgi:hypothetical protein